MDCIRTNKIYYKFFKVFDENGIQIEDYKNQENPFITETLFPSNIRFEKEIDLSNWYYFFIAILFLSSCRFLPHVNNSGAFFVAVIQKIDENIKKIKLNSFQKLLKIESPTNSIDDDTIEDISNLELVDVNFLAKMLFFRSLKRVK